MKSWDGGDGLSYISEDSDTSTSSGDESVKMQVGGRVCEHRDNLCARISSWLKQLPSLNLHLNWPILSLAGVQIPRGTIAALQRNAAVPKDFTRIIPKPIVVVVQINGQPARA